LILAKWFTEMLAKADVACSENPAAEPPLAKTSTTMALT
jgi:hypothetical protein